MSGKYTGLRKEAAQLSVEKKYIVEMNCSGAEDFDGSCWINEVEFKKLQTEKDCACNSDCKLTLRGAVGKYLFSRQVC